MLVVIGCGSPPPPTRAPEAPAPAPERHETGDPRCDTGHSALTVTLEQGKTAHVPFGNPSIDITYLGTTHADYDDGRFENLVHLVFQRGAAKESRLVDVRAEGRAELLLDTCWALTSHGDEVAVTLFPKAQ